MMLECEGMNSLTFWLPQDSELPTMWKSLVVGGNTVI